MFLLQQSTLANCNSPAIPKEFIEIKHKIDAKISSLSNEKLFATEADTILSKLLTNKNPVIADWLKKRNLIGASETEIITQWREYYVKNFILNKYPHDSSEINKKIESLINESNKTFATQNFKEKMSKLFNKSKEHSLKAVDSFPITDKQKKLIKKRISEIKLYWATDFKNSKFKSHPLDFLDWGIAYDPITNEINMGIHAKAYPNDETYLAVFAHEMGHSFDSCRWGAFFEGPWPFEKIGTCLRSKDSVSAKKRDDSKIEEMLKAGKLTADIAEGLKLNPTCNRLVYPPTGTQADQLPESFADWFATETLAFIKDIHGSKLNEILRIDLCENKELTDGSSYPSNQVRRSGIYLAHPTLTKHNKDLEKETFLYCKW